MAIQAAAEGKAEFESRVFNSQGANPAKEPGERTILKKDEVTGLEVLRLTVNGNAEERSWDMSS